MAQTTGWAEGLQDAPVPVALTDGDRQFIRVPRMADRLIREGRLSKSELAAYSILGPTRCLFAPEVMAAWGVKHLQGVRERVQFSEAYLEWCGRENAAGEDWRLCLDLGMSVEEMLAIRGFDSRIVPSFYLSGGYGKERWLMTHHPARYRLVNFRLKSLNDVSLLGLHLSVREKMNDLAEEMIAAGGPDPRKSQQHRMPLAPTYFDVLSPLSAMNIAFTFAMFYPAPFPLGMTYHMGAIEGHPVAAGLFDVEGLHFISLQQSSILKTLAERSRGRRLGWADLGVAVQMHGKVLETSGQDHDAKVVANVLPPSEPPGDAASGRTIIVDPEAPPDPYDVGEAKSKEQLEELSRVPASAKRLASEAKAPAPKDLKSKAPKSKDSKSKDPKAVSAAPSSPPVVPGGGLVELKPEDKPRVQAMFFWVVVAELVLILVFILV